MVKSKSFFIAKILFPHSLPHTRQVNQSEPYSERVSALSPWPRAFASEFVTGTLGFAMCYGSTRRRSRLSSCRVFGMKKLVVGKNVGNINQIYVVKII